MASTALARAAFGCRRARLIVGTSLREGFATSKESLKIHFLDNEGDDPRAIPFVIVPGMMGLADFHGEELRSLRPRRAVAFTHRGLGKSDPICVGQGSFSQRTSDIRTAVRDIGLRRYFLYGFSRGVAMAVAHALEYPSEIAGLILHDCTPVYAKISEKWRDALISANRPHIPAETVTAYWQDSEAVDLSARLTEISCRTLILRGEKEGSLLPSEQACALQELLPRSEISTLPNTAHELADEDRIRFIDTLNAFMRKCEASSC